MIAFMYFKKASMDEEEKQQQELKNDDGIQVDEEVNNHYWLKHNLPLKIHKPQCENLKGKSIFIVVNF